MIKNLYLLLLFLCSGLLAQTGAPTAVTIADLETREYAADPSMPAEYLWASCKTWFEYKFNGWYGTSEITRRIKIYGKDGFNHAKQTILYYSANNEADDCEIISAATYNLKNGQIVKTPLTDDGIFTEVPNEYYSFKKIVMPAVEEGSIIEYTYRYRLRGIALPWWRFQGKVPCRHSECEVAVPVFITVNRYLTGTVKIDESEPRREKNGPFMTNVLRYSANDIPALKEEPYVNNINNYFASVSFEVAAVDYQKGDYVSEYATDWKAVALSIYEHELFGKQLENTGFLKSEVSRIVNNSMTREQKAAAIFNHVQATMKWNGHESYYCSEGIKTAYKEKVGNVGDINLMLVAMLRHAGFEAYPALLSTRKKGIAYFPSKTSYNYCIAVIRQPGKITLLDATSKYTLPDMLPERDINGKGRIITENGYTQEIDLIAGERAEKVAYSSATLSTNGSVEGRTRYTRNNYYAMLFRENFAGTDKKIYLTNLEKAHRGILIDDYKCVNMEDNTKPVLEEYSYSINNFADISAGRMYFNPLLYLAITNNPLTADERKYPLDFTYPFQDKYFVTIALPEGYKAETLPAASKMQLPHGMGSYIYNVSLEGNSLQVQFSWQINQGVISEEHYGVLKEFFTSMVAKNNEKVVLVKQ